MSVPTTYATLQTEIATLAVRDDLTDLIPNFIGYAENWFQRELFSPEREETVTLTVTNGVASLPTDFGGVKMIYVDGTTDTVLDPMTAAKLRTSYPTATTGTPMHYAFEGETVLFGPVPSSGLVIKMKYIEGITALSTDNTTNWLLTDHPDLYVNAALAELFDYTRDADQAALRRQKAVVAANSINRQGQRRKGNSGPLRTSTGLSQTNRKTLA